MSPIDPKDLEFSPPKLPGNFGGETLRQYCGLSRQRKLGRLHFAEPGVSAQDLFRAIGRHKRKGGAA